MALADAVTVTSVSQKGGCFVAADLKGNTSVWITSVKGKKKLQVRLLLCKSADVEAKWRGCCGASIMIIAWQVKRFKLKGGHCRVLTTDIWRPFNRGMSAPSALGPGREVTPRIRGTSELLSPTSPFSPFSPSSQSSEFSGHHRKTVALRLPPHAKGESAPEFRSEPLTSPIKYAKYDVSPALEVSPQFGVVSKAAADGTPTATPSSSRPSGDGVRGSEDVEVSNMSDWLQPEQPTGSEQSESKEDWNEALEEVEGKYADAFPTVVTGDELGTVRLWKNKKRTPFCLKGHLEGTGKETHPQWFC